MCEDWRPADPVSEAWPLDDCSIANVCPVWDSKESQHWPPQYVLSVWPRWHRTFEYRDRFKHRFKNCSLSQTVSGGGTADSCELAALTHTHTHTNSLCCQRRSFNINVPSAGNCFQRSWKAPFIELVKHYPSPSLISLTHTCTLFLLNI